MSARHVQRWQVEGVDNNGARVMLTIALRAEGPDRNERQIQIQIGTRGRHIIFTAEPVNELRNYLGEAITWPAEFPSSSGGGIAPDGPRRSRRGDPS